MPSLRALVLAATMGLAPLAAHGQEEPYPLKGGRPTTEGIERYVEMMDDSVINDFQRFFNVTLYDLYFETDDLRLYGGNSSEDEEPENKNEIRVVLLPAKVGDELGQYYEGQDYAIITNEEKYLGYSLRTTKRGKLWNIVESNQFVRGVMIHETAHDYLAQRKLELRFENISVHPTYTFFLRETAGTLLVEEGIAEYCAITMGEVLQGAPYMPQSKEELFDPDNRHATYYKYGASFVKPILDRRGLAEGSALILTNPPPTDEEILKPELYYARLKEPIPEKREEDTLRFTSDPRTQRPRP